MCDILLSTCTPKLDGSKISHLPINRVYLTNIHCRKSKEIPTYLDEINSCLQSKQTCPFLCLEVIPQPCRGLSGLKRPEWKIKSCNFYKEWRLLWKFVTSVKNFWLLWKVITSMKHCDIKKKFWLLWKVVIFSKDSNFFKSLWPFRYCTHWQQFFLKKTISYLKKINIWF